MILILFVLRKIFLWLPADLRQRPIHSVVACQHLRPKPRAMGSLIYRIKAGSMLLASGDRAVSDKIGFWIKRRTAIRNHVSVSSNDPLGGHLSSPDPCCDKPKARILMITVMRV